VYPNIEDKPPPGNGLNVRARIILLRAWTQDKATREPIKDEKHRAAVKHLTLKALISRRANGDWKLGCII